ncbi:MAG: hypothetical protein JXQ73_28005 [Phycisphaerae bacterium]|nr:hypothetical protein [Phycisphaerae bacterium]
MDETERVLRFHEWVRDSYDLEAYNAFSRMAVGRMLAELDDVLDEALHEHHRKTTPRDLGHLNFCSD